MNENKERRKLAQKQRKTWTRWLIRYRSLIILIFLNVSIGLGIIFGPYLMIVKEKIFVRLQEQIDIKELMKISEEKLIEEFRETEAKEQKSKLEEKKIAAESVLQIFMISNQIIQDREKICQEISDPHEQYSKLMILLNILDKNNKKIPYVNNKFIDFVIFNKDILHQIDEMESLVQKAMIGFPFCERNKDITSALVQKKRLILIENLRKNLLEEERKFFEITENE